MDFLESLSRVVPQVRFLVKRNHNVVVDGPVEDVHVEVVLQSGRIEDFDWHLNFQCFPLRLLSFEKVLVNQRVFLLAAFLRSVSLHKVLSQDFFVVLVFVVVERVLKVRAEKTQFLLRDESVLEVF